VLCHIITPAACVLTCSDLALTSDLTLFVFLKPFQTKKGK